MVQIKVGDFMVCKVTLLGVIQFHKYSEKYEVKRSSLKNHKLCKCFPDNILNTFYTLFLPRQNKGTCKIE